MANFNPNVNWTDDEIGATDKLNQMVQNENILYNLTPEFTYVATSGAKTDFSGSQSAVLKPKIVAGVYQMSGMPGNHGQTRKISFPAGSFAAGCRPVVNVTAAGTGHERYVTTTIASTEGSAAVRNDGFWIQIYHRDGERFERNVIIHYIAFGWQEA